MSYSIDKIRQIAQVHVFLLFTVQRLAVIQPKSVDNQIVKYSLYNCTTIIVEHVRYFINKYDISRDDWNSPKNILYNKIDLYSTQYTLRDYICVATSIRDLCESRDSEYTNFFDRNESRKLIDFLCNHPHKLINIIYCVCILVICVNFLPTAFICICFDLSIICCAS